MPQFQPTRLRALRHLAGLSQRQLAEKVGTTKPMVSCWENGRYTPNRHSQARLASALNVPVDALAGQPSPAIVEAPRPTKVTEATKVTVPQMDEWLRASTEASGVPLKVECPATLGRVAALMRGGASDG